MDGIKVVAHLVRCAADLLMCTDFDTERLRYADVETCRTSLPALIREFQSLSTPGDVVMGRRHFQFNRTPQPEVSGPYKPSASRELRKPPRLVNCEHDALEVVPPRFWLRE